MRLPVKTVNTCINRCIDFLTQSRRELQVEQHGQQELGDLLVADPTADRVQRSRQVRGNEALPRGRRPDDDRSVSVPLLRQGGHRHGLSERNGESYTEHTHVDTHETHKHKLTHSRAGGLRKRKLGWFLIRKDAKRI